MVRLTDAQVNEIRRLHLTKRMKQKDMVAKFGVSLATINNIINDRAYKHVPKEVVEVDKDRPYPCRVADDCDKTFKTAGYRNTHERYHTKPFKCETCNVGYAEKSGKEYCERQHRDIHNAKKQAKPDILTMFNIDGVNDLEECDDITELLRKKYLSACLKHHPDKGGDEDTFKMLQDNKSKLDDIEFYDIDELIKDQKKYRDYHSRFLKYNEQEGLRGDLVAAKKVMNEIRANKGTNNEEFKDARKAVYKLKKEVMDKPRYYSSSDTNCCIM